MNTQLLAQALSVNSSPNPLFSFSSTTFVCALKKNQQIWNYANFSNFPQMISCRKFPQISSHDFPKVSRNTHKLLQMKPYQFDPIRLYFWIYQKDQKSAEFIKFDQFVRLIYIICVARRLVAQLHDIPKIPLTIEYSTESMKSNALNHPDPWTP